MGRNGVVDGVLDSEIGALCKGSAGVADLDISHALTKKTIIFILKKQCLASRLGREEREEKQRYYKRKRRGGSIRRARCHVLSNANSEEGESNRCN